MKEYSSVINNDSNELEISIHSETLDFKGDDNNLKDMETTEKKDYDLILYGVGQASKIFAKIFIRLLSNNEGVKPKKIINDLPVTLFSRITKKDAENFINTYSKFNLKLGYVRSEENAFGKQIARLDLVDFENKLENLLQNTFSNQLSSTNQGKDNIIVVKEPNGRKELSINLVLDIIALVLGFIGCLLFLFSSMYSVIRVQEIDGEKILKTIEFSNFELIYPTIKSILLGEFHLSLDFLASSLYYIFNILKIRRK